MAEVILQTKLNIPPLRPLLIERTRLFDKLNEGLLSEDTRGTGQLFSRKLSLVSAPAGFGKTTLVSSWIHQLDLPVAWLSLDEGDNEPSRFVYYLIAALREANRDLGESAEPLLQSPQPPPLETLFTLLINDLAKLKSRIVFAIDDYHVIHELKIHQALTFLLDNQPPQLHLIIVSREDPFLPLHRLRGSGQMIGIHVRDLRFNLAEATSFLNQTMGLTLSPKEVATLARRTEGWVAGLQLAALSMQGMPNPGAFVALFAGDDRYISDYLIGEVFERQPLQIQEFLLKTALLDRFTASLCDAVLSASDVPERPYRERDSEAITSGQPESSQAIIERLDQSNLFIISLDNKREWYRYHHLFADFLRLRLRQRPESELADVHHRAAAWYEANGLLAEAIDHALKAGDFQRASRLIEQNAMTTIFGHLEWATLYRWMEALPVEMIQSRPRLSIQYIWALFATAHWEAAARLIEDVEPTLEAAQGTAEIKWLRGELAAIAALVAYSTGHLKRSTERAHQALLLLPEDNLTLRCVAHLAIGESAMVQEDAPLARQSLQEAADVGMAAGNSTIVLFALGDLARLEMTEGYLEKAAELYQKARLVGTVEEKAVLGPVGVACMQMGEVLRERNELKKADSVLREGLVLCQQLTGLPNIELEGQVHLARVLLASGDEQGAAEIMQEAESLLTKLVGKGGDVQPIISAALASRLRFWLDQGKLAQAAQWLATNGVSLDSSIFPGDLAYHILLARVLIMEGYFEKAQRQLDRLVQIREKRGSPRLALETLILQALLAWARGDRDLAESTLSQALQLAEPEGYLRLFVDHGAVITPLLERVAAQGLAPANTKIILAAMREGEWAPAEQTPPASHPPPVPGLVEPLKEQELKILRLMAAGLSNREIAAELYLSVNTIKVYASRLYEKLDAHKRAEAVARAHELGLI